MDARPHILIIDDDREISRLFGGRFAIEGFEIMYASEGNEGRELARRFHPDVILLDIRLPGEDGIAIAQRMREEPLTKNIPIIFLTNEDISSEAEKAFKELWVADYIHKSTALEDVVRRVKLVVEQNKKTAGENEKSL